jgi:GTP cyclohydrolase I
MDRAKMQAAIALFVEALGERFEGDDLEKTPERVARAWSEDLLSGYAVDPGAELTWTEVPPGGGPVIVRDVRFTSVCVHHLLPFFGFAQVVYLPGTRQAGLSKIGRVVDGHARRLQTQERLTAAIVDTLMAGLAPVGALALMRAEHTCMTCRGVRKEQSRMLTLAYRGVFESDRAARSEVLTLLDAGPDGAADGG